MKVLFLTTVHNSMSQRMYVELTQRGHEVVITIADTEQAMLQAAKQARPDLILAPYLKKIIPQSLWKEYTCLVVHPGIKGDRGPYSLDWAIMDDKEEWGVTLLQANEEMDAGDIWASIPFSMKKVSKSHLYRHEVTQTAVKCVLQALASMEDSDFVPEPLDYSRPDVKGNMHSIITQEQRKIDWTHTSEEIARKIRAADSHPGVLDEWFGQPVYLYGAHEEDFLKGNPGDILAQRDGAICRATGDGALWITHMKSEESFKLPASLVLKEKLKGIPEISLSPFEECQGRTYREIYYEEKDQVGYVHFTFYNGAMSTDQCIRLRQVLTEVKMRNIRVIVLMGGDDFWSNGIHLNVIENAENPADESWANINAMNDLVREIIQTDSQLTVSAMQGNAGAGGVILALASDYVYARSGAVLNPHYKKMGGLYGSEYWTYLLPRRVGQEKALQLTEQCQPVGTVSAKEMGLIDDAFEDHRDDFCRKISHIAEQLAHGPEYAQMLQTKKQNRHRDEQIKPLEDYRKEELDQMWLNFYSKESSYHAARHQFVYKISCSPDLLEIGRLS